MTKISLEHLMLFVNAPYVNTKGRIADYGGTDRIGKNVIKDGLAKGGAKNYHQLDLDNKVDLLKPIKGPKFDLGICMDLLEHTSNPFIVAENIRNSLKKGAYLFVTVPWIWELHFEPKDYWRFAPQGVQELFSKMETIVIYMLRDKGKGEKLPRHRIVGIFKKI